MNRFPYDLIEGIVDDNEADFMKGYFIVRRINNRRGGRKRIVENVIDEGQNQKANAA